MEARHQYVMISHLISGYSDFSSTEKQIAAKKAKAAKAAARDLETREPHQ